VVARPPPEVDGLLVDAPGGAERDAPLADVRGLVRDTEASEGATPAEVADRLALGEVVTGGLPSIPERDPGRVPTLAPGTARDEVPLEANCAVLGSRDLTVANDPRVPALRRRLASGCQGLAAAVWAVVFIG